MNWQKIVVISSALLLMVFGLAAFFLPGNLILVFNGDNSPAAEIIIQLYGASLVGFGFANWNISHSPVGGIYGRAIVTGNIIHFISGTGLLLGILLGGQTHSGIIICFTFYLMYAAGFTAVLFSSGINH